MQGFSLKEKEEKALSVDLRRKIYGVVYKNPGIHFQGVKRKSGLATGSVQYHLDYLVRKGLLKVEKDGKSSRYYPLSFNSENKKLMSLLRQRSVRSILLFIFGHTGCNHEQIVKFVRLAPSTVSWHIKKLEESGIVLGMPKGRKTEYKLTVDKNDIVNLLVTYQESFFDSIVDNIVEMWDH